MLRRYRSLALYTLVLAVAGVGWLAVELAAQPAFPPVWVLGLCIAFNLFVFQFGIPAPWVGLTSMERLPHVGLLLVVNPAVAALTCAIASLLWPFVSRNYSQGSRTVALIRACHNAAMTAVMLLAGGYAYIAVGGGHPLHQFGGADILPVVVMALTVQVVNVSSMALYHFFDGRDVRALIKPVYSVMDLIFVPSGVLAALLYNRGELSTFALYMILMVVFVLSFSGTGRVFTTDDAQGSPLARLLEAGRALRGARRVDELGARILVEMRTLFRFDDFYLVLVDRETQALDFRVHEMRGERQPRFQRPLASGLFGWVVESGQPILVEDWSQATPALRERAIDTGKPTGSVIAVPLRHDGVVIGVISIQHTEVNVYSRADLNLLNRLADQVAAALADARAFEELADYQTRLEERVAHRTAELEKASGDKERLIAALREQSSTFERESRLDPLTGIANRRHFLQRLSTEIEVAQAVGQPLALAIADLDRFKAVNDELGHPVGDKALRQCASLLAGSCRETDLAARIGGEEFAVFLPGFSLTEASEFCERLRAGIDAHDWRQLHPRLQVTISIGVAAWDGHSDGSVLLEAADAQLYRAKRAGRNRVV